MFYDAVSLSFPPLITSDQVVLSIWFVRFAQIN